MFAPDLATEREDMANSQPLDMSTPCFPKTKERVCADTCGTLGGPGGGGAGGDSIGIYCHASRISLPPATVAKAGEAGQGGLGGAYPVPDGPVMGEQGEPGLANDIIGCN